MARPIPDMDQMQAVEVATDDSIIIDDTSAGETKRINVGDLLGLPNFGWTSTGEVHTFSSFNSTTHIGVVTVPSNATLKYSRGMWYRIAQATGGTKWGKIIAVTTTTITVNFFGSTLVNETINTPFYSPHETPQGAPSLPYIFTEGNGWTVWDYGTERLIFRRESVVLAGIPAGAFGLRNGGVNTPVGFTHAQMGASRFSGSDQALSGQFDHITYTSGIGFDLQNNYTGGTLTPTINWYMEVRTQL